MSEIEHYVGKLIPVLDKTAEDICLQEYGKEELDDYYDSWEEMLEDISYRDGYVLVGNIIYKTELKEFDDYDSIFEGEMNPDGSISVQAKFYNGSCSFTEALGNCIKNAKI